MPPYVMNAAEQAHLADGALAALNATLADEPVGAQPVPGVMDAV